MKLGQNPTKMSENSAIGDVTTHEFLLKTEILCDIYIVGLHEKKQYEIFSYSISS